jgi:hypothetical protein
MQSSGGRRRRNHRSKTSEAHHHHSRTARGQRHSRTQLANGIDRLAGKRARKASLLAAAATKLRDSSRKSRARRRASMPPRIRAHWRATRGHILARSMSPWSQHVLALVEGRESKVVPLHA